jgi:hypothetical protein
MELCSETSIPCDRRGTSFLRRSREETLDSRAEVSAQGIELPSCSAEGSVAACELEIEGVADVWVG